MQVPRHRRAGEGLRAAAARPPAPTSSSSRATPAPTPRRRTATRCPTPRTPAALLAEQVPGIDAILVGHAHLEIPQRFVTQHADRQAGAALRAALLGHAASRVMDLDLGKVRGQLAGRRRVARRRCSTPTPSPEDPEVAGAGPAAAREGRHLRQLRRSAPRTQAMSAATVPVRGHRRDRLHQLRPGRRGQGGPGRHADAAPAGAVDRGAVQPGRRDPGRRRHGPRRGRALHLRQHAARHQAHRRAGQGLPRVLGARTSSRSPAPARSRPTRSPTPSRPTAPNGTPDYNYDIMGGLDAPLTYDIDIAQPVGSPDHEPRVRRRAGRRRTRRSSIAINNYRQSGGGNFPRRHDGAGRLQPPRSRSASCSSTG